MSTTTADAPDAATGPLEQKHLQNPNYRATGLLVPLSTLAGICETFIAV